MKYLLILGLVALMFLPLIKRSMDNKQRQFEQQLQKAFEKTYEEGYGDGNKAGFKAGLKTCDDLLQNIDENGRY